MPRVLVIGSVNLDFTIAAPRLPRPGETVTEGVLLVNHGGKGANQALAARRLGAEARLIACVGADEAGRQVRAALAAEGVGVEGICSTASAATGTALIVVDRDGRNQIAVAPGSNRVLGVEHLRARAADFAWADVVVASLEVPLATAGWALGEARRRRAITICNPAPMPDAALDFLASIDYLTPNAGEAERLSGVAVGDVAAAAAAAERLLALGPRVVVVTLGERGAVACGPHGRLHAPAVPVTALDTTAAGDAFTAALAVALADGRDLAPSLAFAAAAAALTCTRRGAQASLPAREEVERLLGGRGTA